MEAGDLAVIGADDLDTQDYIFEKLRPHTIRKSTPHCTGGEFYFDPDGQYVPHDNTGLLDLKRLFGFRDATPTCKIIRL